MIDASEGDADERFRVIDKELSTYGSGLGERPQVIVLNKADLLPTPAPFGVVDERIVAVHRVSCATGQGIDELKRALFALCPPVPEPADTAVPEVPDFLDYRPYRRRGRFACSARTRASASSALLPRARSSRRRFAPPGSSRAPRSRSATRCSTGNERGGTGILGGAFDPPHNGHLALARGAIARFGLDRLLVRVVEHPGHKAVATPAAVRLRLAELAFQPIDQAEVALDPHGRTVDSLEALGLPDPLFLIGADEFAAFPTWKQPERVLELARIGVAIRPGTDPGRPRAVLDALEHPERVELFPIDQLDIASSEIRERVRVGEPVDELVPPAVAAELERLGLYRDP